MRIFTFLICLFATSALAQAQNTATISFDPVTKYVDGTTIPTTAVVRYDLYQGLKGRVKTLVGAFTSGGSITTGLLPGAEYCWDVIAVVDGVPSDHSVEGCKKFNNVPGTVVIRVT